MTEALKACASRLWRERKKELGEAGADADRLLASCKGQEQAFLRYVLSTLPLSDLGDYSPRHFQAVVRHALKIRQEFPWCAALPEHLFLLYVLYPRINNEELADCRELFYTALADRVRGLSWEQAVLEVNRWCAEQATYRSTDDRTSSALSVYRRGFGRCGEESVFAVSALRSVGIAARQIYAPWWSHCDDNHAWVEVFDGARWRYLGACEPEPELDRGWFTSAASRAMVIHAKAFVPGRSLSPEEWSLLFPDTDPLDLWEEDGVVYETVTHHYGEVRPVTAQVLDRTGQPVFGARLSFSVCNMAGPAEIAARRTGPDGTAVLRLGLGAVQVTAALHGRWGEALADISQTDHIEIVLDREPKSGWNDLDFPAPAGASGFPAPLSPERKALRRAWLDKAAAQREKKSRQAHPEIPRSPEEEKILETLTEKDRTEEIPAEVLSDSLPAFAWEKCLPPEIFTSSLLCPRIGTEPLAPWREKLSQVFSPEEQAALRQEPRALWSWLETHVKKIPSFPALCGTPTGSLRLGAAGAWGRRVLFCALCRSMGIPARLSPIDGEPEFYKSGAFHPAAGRADAFLTLKAPAGQAGLSRRNYSVSRLDTGRWAPLDTGDISAGEARTLPLLPGLYRVTAVSRMPSGTQLFRQATVSLAAGETQSLCLSFREGRSEDLLNRQSLPPFALESPDGSKQESAGLLAEAPFSLLVWLEVGREPTEHILNELYDAAPALAGFCAKSQLALHFVLEDLEQRDDPNLSRLLSLPLGARLWRGDFQDDAAMLARRMFGDPDKLPLVLLADRKGDGLYSCSGYNVGTGELLLRLLERLNPSAPC